MSTFQISLDEPNLSVKRSQSINKTHLHHLVKIVVKCKIECYLP
jgi:hypothetical protein